MEWKASLRRFVLILAGLLLLAVHLAAQTPPLDTAQESLESLESGFSEEEETSEESSEEGGEGLETLLNSESLESGFEDSKEESSSETLDEEEDSFWELAGFLRVDGSYNFARTEKGPGEADYRGLNKLRRAMQLELSLQLPAQWRGFLSGQVNYDGAYGLKGRENYTQETLDTYEQEAEAREVYVAGSLLPALDLKLGRQIVVWGEADSIRVVDVLNPVDNREPGLTDLEDLRLPVTMSRADYYLGDWELTGILIHEIRFNKDPVLGAEFYPLPFKLPEETPDSGGANTETGAALKGRFSGFDLGFYWARVFEDQAHAEPTFSNGRPGIILRHSFITLAGVTGNLALGNWLLKSELAHVEGLRYFNTPGESFARLDGMVGLEFSGISDTTLSLELGDQHYLDFDDKLRQSPDGLRPDVNQTVMSYRGSFLREVLDVVAVMIFFGSQLEQGSLQRYSASYDVADAVTLGGGVVLYDAGAGDNALLEFAKDNDRVFMDAKYSF